MFWIGLIVGVVGTLAALFLLTELADRVEERRRQEDDRRRMADWTAQQQRQQGGK